MTKKKMTAVAAETRPRTIPEAPAVKMVFRSVFAPMEIVMKKVTATKDINGMLARPVAPRATSVKNGPSFKDRMEIAPVSVAFPN